MVRIILCGAQSTGKTTILNYITERFNINKVNETARSILPKYGNNLKEIRSDLDLCKSFQRDILEEQITRENMTEEPYISDRGLDIFAYFAMHTNDTYNILQKEYVKEYLESYKDDGVITVFVRPEDELIENDGIRADLSKENIYRIDGMIKFILESNNINYIVLKSKHLNERVRVLETLLECYNLR